MTGLVSYSNAANVVVALPVAALHASSFDRKQHKDYYLEMLAAEIEVLPEGPHKTGVEAALRQMVARMVVLEESLEKAKQSKERVLETQDPEDRPFIKEDPRPPGESTTAETAQPGIPSAQLTSP